MAVRPLLAVDGDNLAHRAYHALPSSIKGGDGKPANMIVGFANMLIRAWEAEEPRTVFVAFDTLTVPTYRHELLPAYQSGREFPRDLTDQLDRLPELGGALGFPWGKEAGYEADDFLAAAVASEERKKGKALVLTNDRDLFQLASPRTTILHPKRGGRGSTAWGRKRCASGTASSTGRCPTSSRYEAIRRIGYRELRESGPAAR